MINILPPKINLPKRGRRIHFIGIGGVGMGGIAEVMHHLGYAVSGSDIQRGTMTQRLSSLGITVKIGHYAENVHNCDVVVISSAVKEDNPEVQAARARHIPVIPRAEMLGELMRFRQGIAIAGTHGKTTTTSLVTALLAEGNLDPTFVIGGRLNSAGTHANLGTGEYLVAEADESDASFLHLNPIIAVVTNIDADHMSTYNNDFEVLKQTFIKFLQQLPFYGLAVVCIDDPVVREVLPHISKPQLSYGFSEDADIRAVAVSQSQGRSRFSVLRHGSPWLEVELNLPGNHNILNALASIAVAHEVGVSDRAISDALHQFGGIGRRFQSQALQLPAGENILFIDDYGHHPREITAVIDAIRQGWENRRLIIIFQPHRYSRTQELFTDFVAAFAGQEHLILLDVYAAGEAKIEGADTAALCAAIGQQQQTPQHVTALDDVVTTLRPLLQEGDIVLTLGAGNIGALAAKLPQQLQQRDACVNE